MNQAEMWRPNTLSYSISAHDSTTTVSWLCFLPTRTVMQIKRACSKTNVTRQPKSMANPPKQKITLYSKQQHCALRYTSLFLKYKEMKDETAASKALPFCGLFLSWANYKDAHPVASSGGIRVTQHHGCCLSVFISGAISICGDARVW